MGRTARHAVAKSGHVEIVEILLDAAADNNVQNNLKWTTLHVSALHRRDKIAETLLKSGAEVNLLDKAGETALHISQRNMDVRK